MNNFHDYPSEPIGGGNPYYMCSECGRSEPELNGRLDTHLSSCRYRIDKERELLETPTEKATTFKTELAALMKKHGVSFYIEIDDDYAGVQESRLCICNDHFHGVTVFEGGTTADEKTSDDIEM